MKTIQSVNTVTVRVAENEVINGKWLSFSLLSKKIGEIEKKSTGGYKNYRSMLHNSCAGNKYNVETVAGIKCINIDEPMKGSACLVLKFKRG